MNKTIVLGIVKKAMPWILRVTSGVSVVAGIALSFKAGAKIEKEISSIRNHTGAEPTTLTKVKITAKHASFPIALIGFGAAGFVVDIHNSFVAISTQLASATATIKDVRGEYEALNAAVKEVSSQIPVDENGVSFDRRVYAARNAIMQRNRTPDEDFCFVGDRNKIGDIVCRLEYSNALWYDSPNLDKLRNAIDYMKSAYENMPFTEDGMPYNMLLEKIGAQTCAAYDEFVFSHDDIKRLSISPIDDSQIDNVFNHGGVPVRYVTLSVDPSPRKYTK